MNILQIHEARQVANAFLINLEQIETAKKCDAQGAAQRAENRARENLNVLDAFLNKEKSKAGV